MSKKLILSIIFAFLVALSLGWYLRDSGVLFDLGKRDSLFTPIVDQVTSKKLPLLEYSISNLKTREYDASQIVLEKVIAEFDDYTAYLFSYTTQDKKMTGQLNMPKNTPPGSGVTTIIMVRGWVPQETYVTGTGTRNAAAVFASNDYVTIAPDFFGYGESDPKPEESWEERFQKPVNLIELIRSVERLETSSLEISDDLVESGIEIPKVKFTSDRIGIWAHSNGGQIALTALEALGQAIPTTLWAPVTAPFPYSVLFYGDELDDEGKVQRAWLAILERDYDVLEFSLTQHLDLLTGPLQLHHGTADESALQVWSDEFVAKIDNENESRENENEKLATLSAELNPADQVLEPIDITYHTYPGANHNLQPVWNIVVQRDLEFFRREL